MPFALTSTFNPLCESKTFFANRYKVLLPAGLNCKACLTPKFAFSSCDQWPESVHVALLSGLVIDGVSEFDAPFDSGAGEYVTNFGTHNYGFFNAECFSADPYNFHAHLIINTGTSYCEYWPSFVPHLENGLTLEMDIDTGTSTVGCDPTIRLQVTW